MVAIITVEETGAGALQPRNAIAAQRQLVTILVDLVGALAAAPALLGLDRSTPAVLIGVLLWSVLAQQMTRRPTPVIERWREARTIGRGAVLFGIGCWIVTGISGADLGSVGLLAFTILAGMTTFAARMLSEASTQRGPLRALVLAESAEGAGAIIDLHVTTRGRLVGVGTCGVADLSEALLDTRPDIVLALPCSRLSGRVLQRVSWLLGSTGVPLLVATRLADVAASRTTTVCAGTMDLLHVAPAGGGRWLKAAWERGAAGLLLLLALPAMLAAAIAIRLDSPGPVLFRQTRVGRDGRAFTMLKFRTMVPDAPDLLAELEAHDDADGVLFKMRADPRVTRVGRMLRRYSIDELPQLINVLRGEMALIGPRPALPEEVAAYDEDPRHRLVVKPGLTGLWQVSGRSDLSWDESVRLDLDYVDNWSLWRDFGILARTARAVLGHRGAY